MVAADVQRERPDGQQAGGQVRLRKPARQAQAQLDQRQRGVLSALAQQDEGLHVQQISDHVVVPGGPGNDQRLIAVIPGHRVAARLLKQVGRRGQRPGAKERRPRGSRCIEESPEGFDSFGGVPACLPEHPQRGHQPDTGRRIGLVQAERDRGTEIVELEIEAVQPLGLIAGHELRRRGFGQRKVLVAMGSPGIVLCRRVLCLELPRRVLPDGFQQPVAHWPGAGVVELHQVLVDQRPEMSDHLVRGHVTAGGDRLDGSQAEPPGEHGKAGEHVPLGGVQQLPGPVDHGKQRLLAGRAAREPPVRMEKR